MDKPIAFALMLTCYVLAFLSIPTVFFICMKRRRPPANGHQKIKDSAPN